MEYVEVMDTTLRDGEQMNNVSYSGKEKEIIAKFLIDKVNVDRVEYTSALVGEKEYDSLKEFLREMEKDKTSRIEILGFLNEKSVEWVKGVGGKVVNILAKGSLNHLRQLRHSKDEHISVVGEFVDRYKEEGLKVNVYLEDGSNGYFNDREYVYELIDSLKNKVERVMIPDTLGVLSPKHVYEFKELISDYRKVRFDFHAHNDYGMATANTLSAVEVGFKGVHVSVNGMGERAGNAALEEVVCAIHDFTDRKTRVNERKLREISEIVEGFSYKRVASNKPIVGEDVFNQTAGVHADGDKKGGLYVSRLSAERFGVSRKYSLGKLSGKANIEHYVSKWGFYVDKDVLRKITKEVVGLGEKKEMINEADLFFIVKKYVVNGKDSGFFKIKKVKGKFDEDGSVLAYKVEIKGREYKGKGKGVGAFDAMMKMLREKGKELGFKVPVVKDYNVVIPKGGRSDAIVETIVKWDFEGNEFTTIGMDLNQVVSSLKAIEKAINYINMVN